MPLLLGTKVTKYYNAAKIRDEKRGTEQINFTWKPLNIQGEYKTSL